MDAWGIRAGVCVAVVAWVGGCGDDGAAPPVDAGTLDASTDGPGPSDATADVPRTCETDDDCDDDIFCNGTDRCVSGTCERAPRVCDDSLACTEDRCDEAMQVCAAAAPDADGDGHLDAACLDGAGAPLGDDCDDADGARYAGATEVCDTGHDEDCNPDTVGARDGDMDGYTAASCCNGATCGDDCDDTRPGVHPLLPEVCDDVDNDCDGMVDEMATAVPWYPDRDSDGHGDPSGPSVVSCAPVAGHVTAATDCDDTDPGRNPGAPEVCDGVDNDCDTVSDDGVLVTFYTDDDGDGFGTPDGPTVRACALPPGYSHRSTDCDDTSAGRNPSAPEVCNDIDEDCDTSVDESVRRTFYRDADGDGDGDPAGPTTTACYAPMGYAAQNTDCDDTTASRRPGLAEVCDGLDNDCDATVDDGLLRDWYRDVDRDFFGDPTSRMTACTPPMGYVVDDTDCDDTRGNVYPGAVEACDGRDNDCDGMVDEDGIPLWFRDADADSFGSRASGTLASCMPPVGYAGNDFDCDDTNNAINPGVLETCNGRDDNCDGTTDEGVQRTFYRDVDNDDWGIAAAGVVVACARPLGYGRNDGDCDDTRSTVHPDATETCDGFDTNCAAGLDFPGEDDDRDGHGDNAQCGVPTATDCNDGNATVFPGAPELCDRLDNNCSSGGSTDAAEDADLDGYAPFSATCTGGPLPRTDCNDAAGAIHPGAPDDCGDEVDENCDGRLHRTRVRSFDCGAATCARVYAVCARNVLWGPARMDCQNAGYDLVRIDDAEENAWVLAEATAAGLFDMGAVFIGASDETTEGVWRWGDGTQFWMGGPGGMSVGGRYQNWAVGEPANGLPALDRGVIGPGGRWSTIGDFVVNTYVCRDPCVEAFDGATRYLFCTAPEAWMSAAATCSARGARPVRIDGPSENSFVASRLSALGLAGAWLGASDTAGEGAWRWSDGAQFWMGGAGGTTVGGLFANWAVDEPAADDCGRIDTLGTWHADACTLTQPVICEVY